MALSLPRCFTALVVVVVVLLESTWVATCSAQAPAPLASVPMPEAGDDSAAALRRFERGIVAAYGGGYWEVPLEVKAEFFEWCLWRYHRTPYRQIYNRVRLATEAGTPPVWMPGPDSSTWNGALLAALSYKYAATREPETLRRLAELLDGMHLFLHVTGQPGLPARSVIYADGAVEPGMRPATGPDGTSYMIRSEAAKGTVNQIAQGYAAVMMHAYDDLPADVQRRARDDLALLALHLVNHDYHLTEPTGQRTPYGDLTPRLGSMGIPFNAQVAYLIVAAAHRFPPDDEAARSRLAEHFRTLRDKHHVYYERPWLNLVLPQRVGASPFVKGMNDRNHVTTAAFVGLQLDVAHARRAGVPLDRKFLYELGQTMNASMELLQHHRNSLCHFMWAALLNDAEVRSAVVGDDRGQSARQVEHGLRVGCEQLRRFPLDRFTYEGHEVAARGLVWVDQFRPDDYYWKCDPQATWQVTGGPTNDMYCAIDYLHAYWLLRCFRLDEHPALAAARSTILRRTPGLSTLAVEPRQSTDIETGRLDAVRPDVR